jgi:hypothetical protein
MISMKAAIVDADKHLLASKRRKWYLKSTVPGGATACNDPSSAVVAS